MPTCPHSASLLVPIPQFVIDAGGVWSFDPTHPEYGIDDEGRKCLWLDPCVEPAVQALWSAGIVTIGCCCGHDEAKYGVITVDVHGRAKHANG